MQNDTENRICIRISNIIAHAHAKNQQKPHMHKYEIKKNYMFSVDDKIVKI